MALPAPAEPRSRPHSQDAAAIYLRGHYLVLRSAQGGPGHELLSCQDYYERACALDPSFAPAVAGLAVGGWLVHATSNASPPLAAPRTLRLTHSGQVGCAAIAPSGRHFALVVGTYSEEAGGTLSRASLCGGTLVVRPLPTGPDQVITRVELVETLRWSPSGDALILVGRPENKARGAWLFPTNGGAARQLAPGRSLSVGFDEVRRVDPATGRFAGEPMVIQGGVPQGGSLTADVVTNTLMWVPRVVTDELHLVLLPSPTTTRLLTRSLNAYLGRPVFSPGVQRLHEHSRRVGAGPAEGTTLRRS